MDKEVPNRSVRAEPVEAQAASAQGFDKPVPCVMQPLGGISPDTPLAADLLDASGRVLLQCGTLLSAPLLESLKRRGIVCAPVATPDNGSNTVAFEEREAALRGHIAHLFRLAGDDASAVRLKQLVLAHRLRKLSGNGHVQ